jgi:hypothetical protein
MHDDSLTEAAWTQARRRLDGLAVQAPGPGLTAGLVELRSGLVSDADSVRVVALWARQLAWVQAQAMRAMSDCCPSSDNSDAELTVHEVAAMTHSSEVTTGTELALMMQPIAELRPPDDPPPLDNEGRERTEHLIDAQLWQRFDEAAYAHYWQRRNAS